MYNIIILLTFVTSDILSVNCDVLSTLQETSVFYGVTASAEHALINISSCKSHLWNIFQGIEAQELWALKLFDASGVPSTGLHWGNTYWLGSRQQCLASSRMDYRNLNPSASTRLLLSAANAPPFPVDYFVAYLRHSSSFQIPVYWDNETKVSVGLCLPSSCSEQQVSTCLKEYLSTDKLFFKKIYNTSLSVLEVKRTKHEFNLHDPVFLILMVVFMSIAVCVISGTTYDYQMSKKNKYLKEIAAKDIEIRANYDAFSSIWIKIVLAFSFTRHFKELCNTSAKSTKFRSIAGIRTITMSFIIISHSILFWLDFYNNRVFSFDESDRLVNQTFQNSSYSTDAFFCMGGFLIAYSIFKHINRQKKQEKAQDSAAETQENENNILDLGKEYISGVFKRYMRLTPTYAFTVLLTIILLTWRHQVDSLWINERNDLRCRDYWWSNMLYINNIYPGRNMCMYWTHYLALDMQFFVLVTFICHLSKKFFKLSASLLASLFIASMFYIGYTTYTLDYRPYSVNFYRYIEVFYYPPWMRIGSYIVGIVYGYAYCRLDGRLHINKNMLRVLWTAVMVTMCYLEYGFQDRDMSIYRSVFFMSCSRTLWAACVGWIILSTLTGNAGFLNDLLSFKIWLPFSRLTYSAYLINPLIAYVVASYYEKSLSFDPQSHSISGGGLLFLTFSFAVPMTCCVEMPSREIFDILYNWLFSKDQRAIVPVKEMFNNNEDTQQPLPILFKQN